MADPNKGFIERLFAEHRRALQSFFYRRIKGKAEAPDLVREVCLDTVASNLAKVRRSNAGRPLAWTPTRRAFRTSSPTS